MADGDPRAELTTALGHQFDRPELLDEALTHPSAVPTSAPASYERLEFLGDRVLGLVIAELLFRRFPRESEGDLAHRLSVLVSGDSLASVARDVGLGRYLILTPGEDRAGARQRPSILADACEAVIGAVFLDGGLAPAAALIARWWHPLMSRAAPPRDAKTELQEWAQARGLPLPAYETVASEGPPHYPLFTVEARVEGLPPARASGRSKRLAEQEAARALLDGMKDRDR